MAINNNGTITHAGLVLGTTERNAYDDSDFVAAVWNPDTEAVEYVTYDSTRYAGGGSATVDAGPDVVAKATAFMAARIAEINVAKAREDAMTPVKGRRVRSTTTRGKNTGVEGVVMWRGEKRSRFGTWSYGCRIGIKVDGETRLRYLDDTSVVVLDPPDVDEAEIARHAAGAAVRRGWLI